MKIKEVRTYQIPNYYLPAIFNADFSGLTDEDESKWEKFIKKEKIDNEKCVWEMPSHLYPYFSCRNDIIQLGGDVIDLKLYIF